MERPVVLLNAIFCDMIIEIIVKYLSFCHLDSLARAAASHWKKLFFVTAKKIWLQK